MSISGAESTASEAEVGSTSTPDPFLPEEEEEIQKFELVGRDTVAVENGTGGSNSNSTTVFRSAATRRRGEGLSWLGLVVGVVVLVGFV